MDRWYSFKGVAHTEKLRNGDYEKIRRMVVIERTVEVAAAQMIALSGLPEATVEEQYELIPSEQETAQRLYAEE